MSQTKSNIIVLANKIYVSQNLGLMMKRAKTERVQTPNPQFLASIHGIMTKKMFAGGIPQHVEISLPGQGMLSQAQIS